MADARNDKNMPAWKHAGDNGIPRTAVRGWFKFFLLPKHFSLRRASRGMDLIAFHLESVPDKLPDWDYGYVMNGEVPRQKFEF